MLQRRRESYHANVVAVQQNLGQLDIPFGGITATCQTLNCHLKRPECVSYISVTFSKTMSVARLEQVTRPLGPPLTDVVVESNEFAGELCDT